MGSGDPEGALSSPASWSRCWAATTQGRILSWASPLWRAWHSMGSYCKIGSSLVPDLLSTSGAFVGEQNPLAWGEVERGGRAEPRWKT